MGLDDRLWYLLLGMAIGFVLGRFTRSLGDIKEELDEVDEIVKEKLDPDHDMRKENEGGFINPKGVSGIALLIVIVVTVGAAFLSQKASNDAQNAQEQFSDVQTRLTRVTACNTALLSKTIVALNERTKFSGAQADANIKLQQSQSRFFDLLLHRPPYTPARQYKAAKKYQLAQHNFLGLNQKTANTIKENPYPTPAEMKHCLVVATRPTKGEK